MKKARDDNMGAASCRMKGATAFAAICVALALTGCAELDSIYRKGDLFANDRLEGGKNEFRADGQYIVTDAKQRLVTYMRVTPDRQFAGRVGISKVVCAEPSPDVAQAIQQALSASLSASTRTADKSASLGGDAGFAAAESVAQLGRRIATIQLLRDELADLCRSFANGAVSSTTYTLRLSRLDKKMITLLMGEAATGALSQPTMALLGAAGGGTAPIAGPEELAAAEKARSDALKELQSAEEALAKATTDDDKAAKRAEVTKAQNKLYEKEIALMQLRVRTARAQTGASMPPGAASAPATISDRVADIFPRLQKNFLEDDDLGIVLDACINSLDALAIAPSTPQEAKDKLSKAEGEARKAEDAFRTARGVVIEKEGLIVSRKRAVEDLERRIKESAPAPDALVTEVKNLRADVNTFAADLETAYKKARDAESAYLEAKRKLNVAEQEIEQDKSSKLALWCRQDGMRQIVDAINTRDRYGYDEKMLKIRTGFNRELLQRCAPLLADKESKADDSLLAYCRKALGGEPDGGEKGPPAKKAPAQEPKKK